MMNLPELPDDVPILLTPEEYENIGKRGRNICLHRWEYRAPLPAKRFAVVYHDGADYISMPRGRVCKKCRKVQFYRGPEAAYKNADPWRQGDFSGP